MATGTVKWYNAAQWRGFITPDDGGPDVYFHGTAIKGSGPKELVEGTRVKYDNVTQAPKGPQAGAVFLLS